LKKIFDPQAKVTANADRVFEHLETGLTAPVLIEFDPSNACNHGCSFCISGHIHLPESKGLPTFNRNMLSRDLMIRTCKEFVEMGVRAVNWTGGGEPTANPALKECIEYLGKNDVKMGMFTNGTLLHTFDLFDTLLEYMTWVRFSIDAGDPETYDRVRRTVKGKNDWYVMFENLCKLLDLRVSKNLAGNPNEWSQTDIGVGFVITPDTYKGVVNLAKAFKGLPDDNFLIPHVDYVQYKPEIVNVEREGGIQREAKFWKEEVQPLLDEAKEILGDKFQINGYHFQDLEDDPELLGRTYKKCLGSQISPCVGADGEVYVCTNHRGHKQYSYGNLRDRTFEEIWNDITNRQKVMHQIDDVEKFSNCTQLCKPHESNKQIWAMKELKQDMDVFLPNVGAYEEYKNTVLHEIMPAKRKNITHWEFI